MKAQASTRQKKWIDIISALFVLLFLYTAIEKLRSPAIFSGMMSRSPLLYPFSGFLSWAIPCTELLAVALLFIPRARGIGVFLSVWLMILFTFYIVYVIYFTPQLPCTCGGVIEAMSWSQHLVFNSFFLVLGAVGLILCFKSQLRKK